MLKAQAWPYPIFQGLECAPPTASCDGIELNALSRLWWWAEITHAAAQPIGNPDRYIITKKVQDRQSLMLWLVDCAFSGQPKIVRELSAIQEAESLNDSAQKKICRSVNRLARVICLDALSEDEEAKALCGRALQVSQLLAA